MFYAFNIVLIGLVLLIAYWWANQGLFSAILHLLAVIAAGAIALGLWEPITTNLLLRGSPFDDFAWGVCLIGVFCISLLAIRVALDKLVPGNVNLPHWVNLVFGLPVGFAAGVLTLGMFVIGAGFVQSSQDMLGYRGWGRSGRTGKVEKLDSLWLPVNVLTSDFYSALSVGSLRTGQPLSQYEPDIHIQACLVRDSYKKGQAKLSLQPDDASVTQLLQCQENPQRFVVQVRFSPGAQDFGEQLTLSSAQVRMIGAASGASEAPVVHPDHWSQKTKEGSGRFSFDDVTHYITSVPGQQSTEASIEFTTPPNFVPKFVQIRNTRYVLPAPVATMCGEGGQVMSAGVDPATVSQIQGGQSIQGVIEVERRCRPITASANQLPAGIQVTDQKLSGGEGTFPRGGSTRIGRSLRIDSFFAPKGAAVVQVEVTRNGPVDFYGPLKNQVEPNAKIVLVDSTGNTYAPIGYMHIKKDEVDVKLDPRNLVDTVEQMPLLPTSGTQTLKLIFRITEGVEIAGMRWGDVTVGSCSLTVKGRSR